MYLTPAVESRVGVSEYCLMMRWISAFERIPDVPVQFPGFPPPEKAHCGLLHELLASVNDRP
jgi:hypothetical protein